MGSLNQYLHSVDHLYQTGQGQVLARMLSLKDDHVHNQTLWMCDVSGLVARRCPAPLNDMIINHLLCIKALHDHDYIQAFNYQTSCMNEVMKILRNQRGSNWMLPLMFTVCLDLRMTAQKADPFANAKGEILEKAAETLMECFRICSEDTTNPEEHSKKIGILGPVNHLLRIYFRMQQYNMCQSMIGAVEAAVNEGVFSMSQLVTFRFFVGRLACHEGNFQMADQNLTFAYKRCHPQSFKNKRTILTYLLPVKMLLGYMPAKSLLEKYDLPLFWHLLSAVKGGRLKVFEDITMRNRRYFEAAGLNNAIRHLKIVAYRNVLKKVYLSLKTTRIPISSFQAGLQLMSKRDVDISGTQCLIATMIFHHRINAYMSYSHKMVIFSPCNPFPRLSTLNYLN